LINYTLARFNESIQRLAEIIRMDDRKNRYLCLYPIPRGGIPVAMALSKALNIPLTDDPMSAGVLIVDDVVDTGNTIRPYLEGGAYVAALHVKSGTSVFPIYHSEYFDQGEWIEYWWEKNEAPAEDAVVRLLQSWGEDPTREGLLETPKRFIKAFQFLTAGYKQNPKDLIKTFDADGYDEIVLLKDIEMYPLYEHHILPFFGKAHVAYIPDKRIIGTSKLARIVDMFSKRLQVQERICNQVTDLLMNELQPKGAACIIEAGHLCTRMRGVEKQNSVMVTSSMKGVFLTDQKARQELMGLIR